LLDHIIIGRRRRAKTVARMGRKKREAIAAAMRGYFSFKEAGEL